MTKYPRYSPDLERGNASVASDLVRQLPMDTLNILKAHESTRLALQVIEKCGQCSEFLRTSSVRAVIHLLSMGRRFEVLI